MSTSNSSAIVNIPFVDDEEDKVIHNGNSNDSLNSLERAEKYQRSISHRKGVNLRIIIDDVDGGGDNEEREKLDKPGPLISDLVKNALDVPTMGLRRNSFSMPALNENDLDALRALHMKSINVDDDMETPEKGSKESLSDIQVSSFFHTFFFHMSVTFSRNPYF